MARAAHLPFRPRGQSPAGRVSANAPGDANGAPPAREKGRGACSNASGRYESEKREAFDDCWEAGGEEGSAKTNVSIEYPKKIITFNKSPFVGFDRSINPYRGCEHGCVYCFARPTHAYLGLSPGLDFEREIWAKPSASDLLRKELSNSNYRPRVVAMGANTDPYQPVERRLRIMRGLLTIFAAFNHPVTILTKSLLVARDADILAPMAALNLTRAMISITTTDRRLARSMEPRASSPEKRFEAIERLSRAGVQTGVMTGPMIPGLNDDEMETIMERAAASGATFSAYTILRLPLEVSPIFQEWLEAYAPARAKRVMRHIREMNGGRNYDPHWSRGREIKSPYALLIAGRHASARKRFALPSQKPSLDLSRFRPPPEATPQLSLFNESEAG